MRMRQRQVLVFLVLGVLAPLVQAQTDRRPAADGREAPPQAYADCRGKRAGDSVRHRTRDGAVAATCVESANGLVARPGEGPRGGDARPPETGGASKYSLEQAMSDRAQLNTIAFDALAFLTGDFAYDTFLPPGKVSDYFGFQYLRDIDAREGGHNTHFLTRIAYNLLTILSGEQKARLVALAKAQQDDIRRFAELRLPLIKAFRLNLEGRLPAGSRGLDRLAIRQYSAELYALDGQLAHERARVMAAILRSLNPAQKQALSRLKFGDSATWPELPEPLDRRSMTHGEHVAVMTYASEMFSWYAGSLAADTYFCPERHGMYFGGFGMKTAPAMGKRDYSISTSLTGNSGEAFLAVLTDRQRQAITALPEAQRSELQEIARIRHDIAGELRHFLDGGSADLKRVLSLSRRYGELDGQLSYLYATAFAQVGQSLSPAQKQALAKLRKVDADAPKGPFLYSSPVSLPKIDGVERFFTPRG